MNTVKIRGTVPSGAKARIGATLHLPASLSRYVSSPGAALADVLGRLPAEYREQTVIIAHGTLVTQLAYYRAAGQLVPLLDAPVLTYDRRGRMDSSAQPADYSAQTEIEDLQALLAATGASRLLGHSFGGMVALLTAAEDDRVKNVVTYDAPINLNGRLNHMWSPDADDAFAAGQTGRAWALLVNRLATAGPLSWLPVPLLTQVSRILPLSGSGREHLRLMGTCLNEMRAVVQSKPTVKTFANLPETTLITGGFSPKYFVQAAQALATAMPSVHLLRAAGYFHEGPMRGDRKLARALAEALNR
ncbi:alpha/beta fold hydrolase [Micrococcoides hystricis]|uniref:Alpha/beta fold hydrolase n=1 Tax=Micrococcoides hystricis TaxID=1572761 RepID=A0ABV6PB59_9MICC